MIDMTTKVDHFFCWVWLFLIVLRMRSLLVIARITQHAQITHLRLCFFARCFKLVTRAYTCVYVYILFIGVGSLSHGLVYTWISAIR